MLEFEKQFESIIYIIPEFVSGSAPVMVCRRTAIETASKSLKIIVDDLKISNFSISKVDYNMDNYDWIYIEHLLRMIFNDKKYHTTICSGDIMIPVEFERANIVKEYHESLVGGHQGVTSLYNRIRQDFYWSGLYKEVEQFVLSCPSCQKNKNPNQRTRMPMRLTDTPKRAFDKIQMDILGPLPISETGNRCILTIQFVLD